MRPVKTSVDEGTVELCPPVVKPENKLSEKKRKPGPMAVGRSEWARRYSAIQYAVRKGVMPNASEMECERCGQQAAHKHHEDYAKPLEVNYLCVPCHRQRHRELGWGTPGAKRGSSGMDFSYIPVGTFDFFEDVTVTHISQAVYYFTSRSGMKFRCFTFQNGVVVFRIA